MKFIYFVTAILMAASLLGPGALAMNHTASSSVTPFASVPTGLITHVPIAIDNNMTVNTTSNFDEMIVVNSIQFSGFENKNLSNVYFTYSNGTVIGSWLQSGNLSSDSNTTYWLVLKWPIPSKTTITIEMDFLPLGKIAFNHNTTGEAPQLSTPYAFYDNGAKIFPFYDNFAGTSLNLSLWNNTGRGTCSGTSVVDNGLHLTSTHNIYSTRNFTSSSVIESCGLIGPGSSNSTSNFLNGVGFSSNGFFCSGNSIASGWATNSSNGPGMSQWIGNGVVYTFNYSHSINPNKNNIYGIGFVNVSHFEGIINNQVGNVSTHGLSCGVTLMNATMGFQQGDYSANNSFYWVFVRNGTIDGQINLPYTVGSNFTFHEIGLPSNVSWNVSIKYGNTVSGYGAITTQLLYGNYNVIFSAGDGYIPYPSSIYLNFSPYTSSNYVVYFEAPSNTTYLKSYATFSLRNGTTSQGYRENLSTSQRVYSGTMAFDTMNSVMYVTSSQGVVTGYNTTTGKVQSTIKDNNSIWLYYDSQANLLYSSQEFGNTGNLSIINPSNSTIIKNEHFNTMEHNFTFLINGSGNGTVALVIVPNSNSYKESIVYLIESNGTVIKNYTIQNFSQNCNIIQKPVSYHGDIYEMSSSGVIELNLTTGKTTIIPLPSGIVGIGLFPYGDNGQFIIGNLNSSNPTTNLIFNSSTMSFSPAPKLGGPVISSGYDSITGVIYLQTITNFEFGLYAVNQSSGRILASSPYPGLAMNMIADPSNSKLYTTDNPLNNAGNGYIHIFSTSKLYSVNFLEKGIPYGTSWIVNTNGVNHTVTGGKYTVQNMNGTTYNYRIYSSTYYSAYGNLNGSVTINGSNSTVNFSYAREYNVSFIETGLPSGSSWILSLNGKNYTITGSTMEVQGVNGTTFHFNTFNSTAYYTSGFSVNSATISGSNISLTVKFYHWAYIFGNFTQSKVNVSINGVNYTPTSGNLNLSVIAGNYSVIVYGKGFVSVYYNFSLNPGQSENISAILKQPYSANGIGNNLYLYAGGTVAILVVVLAGIYVYMRRK